MAAAAALPMAPAGVRDKFDTMVTNSQTGLFTPHVSSARAQASAQLQAVAKVSHLQNLVLFPLIFVVGLQTELGACSPPALQNCSSSVSPLLPVLSPPKTGYFYKADEE